MEGRCGRIDRFLGAVVAGRGYDVDVVVGQPAQHDGEQVEIGPIGREHGQEAERQADDVVFGQVAAHPLQRVENVVALDGTVVANRVHGEDLCLGRDLTHQPGGERPVSLLGAELPACPLLDRHAPRLRQPWPGSPPELARVDQESVAGRIVAPPWVLRDGGVEDGHHPAPAVGGTASGWFEGDRHRDTPEVAAGKGTRLVRHRAHQQRVEQGLHMRQLFQHVERVGLGLFADRDVCQHQRNREGVYSAPLHLDRPAGFRLERSVGILHGPFERGVRPHDGDPARGCLQPRGVDVVADAVIVHAVLRGSVADE
jgi:hypothetical protein